MTSLEDLENIACTTFDGAPGVVRIDRDGAHVELSCTACGTPEAVCEPGEEIVTACPIGPSSVERCSETCGTLEGGTACQPVPEPNQLSFVDPGYPLRLDQGVELTVIGVPASAGTFAIVDGIDFVATVSVTAGQTTLFYLPLDCREHFIFLYRSVDGLLAGYAKIDACHAAP